MNKVATYRLVIFFIQCFVLSFFAGCAGHEPKVDEGVAKVDKAPPPPPVKKNGKEPGEKIFADEEGEFEIVPTPFGHVKRRIRRPKKESKQPTAGAIEPSAGSAAEGGPPVAPSVYRTKSDGAALAPPEKLDEEKVPEEDGDVIFNFDDADLYEVIRTIAEILKINYMVDSNVSGKVTIHTAGRLKKEDIFPVFFQILEASGLTAAKEGSIYRIITLKDAPRMPITSRLGREGGEVPPGERIIMQIIPLKFISVQEMTSLLTPFISTSGTIISHEDSNTLLVVDKGINILKSLRLVETFDVDLFEKVEQRFYFLENIDAEDMVKLLEDIVSAYATGEKVDVKFIAIERLNALLAMSSRPRFFEKIERFVHKLDVESEEVEPRIYVYSVKNGEARELADLLDQVFAKGTSEKEKEDWEKRKAEEPATPPSPNPFAQVRPVKKEKETFVTKAKGETAGTGTLRDEVKIIADEIRNSLIIEAIPADFRVIEDILKRLDVLPRQVLIEVVVADVTLDESTDLGIEWTYLKGDGSLSTTLYSATLGSSGLFYDVGQTDRWTNTLEALAAEKKVNILSSPSVLASDNKEARIDISTEIPVSSAETTTTGENPVTTTTIQYRDTGVLLTVTPHINERGLVTMDVSQEVSEEATGVSVGGSDYPSFFKRSVNTTLTVGHAQTIVIGGLIKETSSESESGVPWLSDIPVLGYLFGAKNKSVTKTELIILITPYVIASLEDVDAVTEDFKRKVGNIKHIPM
ncbi:MAG: type II secretion system secretin GspD [Thermodesulfobacteriota bacterium]|nr:type II secretion system secretin GspD [Thermodesulfobacteriota bacterium]